MTKRARRTSAVPDGEDLTQILVEGVARHQAGRLDEAAAAYRKVLARSPDHPHALHLLGVIQHQTGEHEVAARLIGKAIALLPDYADFHSNLGAAQFALKHFEQAAASFRRAGELNPASAEARSNLAAALGELGDHAGAVTAWEAAHRIDPANPRFLKRLGDFALELERFHDAVRWFQLHLARVPDSGEVHSNLGYAFERLGRLEDAERAYRRASELEPGVPEINNNLATVLRRLGRDAEAQEYFQKALAADPEKWEDLAHLAGLYLNRREPEKALPIYETLLERQPDNACIYNDYGICLSTLGRAGEGNAAFEKAIALDPSYPEPHNNLGTNRVSEGDRVGAVEAFKSAIKARPRYLDAHVNLCLALHFLDRYDEAYLYAKATVMLEDFRPLYVANPSKVFRGVCDFDALEDLGDPWKNIEASRAGDVSALFLEMLVETDDAPKTSAMAGWHRFWGDDLCDRAEKDPLPARRRSKRDKIRLGVLSADLRSHSVAKFTVPLFERLDHDRFELFCYAPTEYPADPVQARIRGMVERFTVMRDGSMREMAEIIAGDEVDILFELNGFTRDSRIKIAAWRPAPVQISYLGYPFTTGIRGFDYLLLDPLCRPADDSYLVEKPLLMPESWVCFGEFPAEPISETLPVERNGVLTFGTLNNPYKYTRKIVALWAKVMQAVPGSRFLVVRPECASMMLCANLVKEFGRHGIGPERINIVNNRTLPLSHFSYYDEIDISLDTFPVTGGTTTCEALWMGVPVVALTGPSVHHRLSRSLLVNAGYGDLVAETPAAYVARAIALANDRDALRTMRREARGRLQASPLCDADRFTRNFEALMTEVALRHGLR